MSGLNDYQYSLLNPHFQTGAKVTGTFARSSIPIHRYFSATYLTNPDGNLCIYIQPNEVCDSTMLVTTSFLTNDGSYNPSVPAVATLGTTPMSTIPFWNLTANTAKHVRLVSASFKLTSLVAPLNRSGIIYGSLLPNVSNAAINLGGNTGAIVMPTISSIQNNRGLVVANVTNGEGVQVNYLPSDEDDLQFLAPNITVAARHGTEDINQIVIIAQGCKDGANQGRMFFEAYVNFEVIPVQGSSLAGMETEAPNVDSIPALDISHIRKYHMSDLLRLISAFPSLQPSRKRSNSPDRDRDNVRNSQPTRVRQPLRVKDWAQLEPNPKKLNYNIDIKDFPDFNIENTNPSVSEKTKKQIAQLATKFLSFPLGGKRNLRTKKRKLVKK